MSQSSVVGIISTGVANTASVVAAFRRLGVETELVSDWRKVESARRLVLPGVGSFGCAMDRLNELKMVEPLRERILSEIPTLAICLGLQLFCSASEESPGMEGLSILPTTVKRFDVQATEESRHPHDQLRVPHLGWNQVKANSCKTLSNGQAYFAHSFYIDQVPPGWNQATAHHGGSFVAAIEKGSVLACQFHPELSGSWGRELLATWLGKVEVPAC